MKSVNVNVSELLLLY